MLRELFLSAFLTVLVASDSCEDCLASGKHFCATVNKCGFSPCATTITRLINCPSLPDAAHAYDDNFARTKFLPLIGAGATDTPAKCFANNWPTMKLYNTIHINCSTYGPEAGCFMYTAFDTTQKIIVMGFRGTQGSTQLSEEIGAFFLGKRKFFDVGYVFEYFYDAFMYFWNAGLSNDIRQLKYLYPDFDLWVTGHSLGGALSSVAASYVVKAGIFQGQKIKLLTVGQPRTGDYDYALWHQNTFPYSYRVVHHKDIVPHVAPQLMPDGDEMFHHRTEIWYNNNMTIGAPYNVCKEADGLHCSNTQVDTSFDDHMYYYNTDLGVYGPRGCPKQ